MTISVIIPLYNKSPYVEKAIKSVLSQTYTDYELIIINDGSTDDSLEVARQVVDGVSSNSIQIIDQPNSGVSTTRNNGVALAKGDYIAFLDADDWWSENFLEEMADLIKEYPQAGIYGAGYYIVKNGQNRIAPIGVDADFTFGIINYCQVYARILCMPLCASAVVIKKSVFEEFAGFKPHLKLGEDFDLWIRVALTYPVAFLNKQLAYYNQDVDLQNRAIGRLHEPSTHMLWNLDYLNAEESTNKDYKALIDKLRVHSLFRYYLSDEYRNIAIKELNKVDWSLQPKSERQRYNTPLWRLRLKMKFMQLGSRVKQTIFKKI